MSTPAVTPPLLAPFRSPKLQLYVVGIATLLGAGCFVVWPRLSESLWSTNFLPHSYCYLKNPALVWTHVASDSLIAIAYLSISTTMAYLVYRGRREMPFQGLLTAFALFILFCGSTHIMEVVTVWLPVYILSGAVKLLAAVASLIAAVVLPFTVPQTLALVQQAKISEQVTADLRASEERKGALLREVHHRVKNNMAVICSLFYLQASHSKDPATAQTFRDMERRVHSMALVHETLYGAENPGRIDLAQYAQDLAQDILSSHGSPGVPLQLKTRLERVIMNVDLAVLCGLILNELISNAMKHAFPAGAGGQIKVSLRATPEGKCSLCVEDNGVGVPPGLDVTKNKSLGLRLVRTLAKQLGGSFELAKLDPGTSACLTFTVNQHER